MELYPILLVFACVGGLATLVLVSFCVTVLGSISSREWSAGAGLGPIAILLLPGNTLELWLFEKPVFSFRIPEDTGEAGKKEEEIDGEILKKAEKESGFPFSALLKLPISIDSVSISGRIGTGDAGETGKLYGWIAALRGALRTTRLDLNIIPDFAEAGWSANIRARIRIRSLFHLVIALLPFIKR